VRDVGTSSALYKLMLLTVLCDLTVELLYVIQEIYADGDAEWKENRECDWTLQHHQT